MRGWRSVVRTEWDEEVEEEGEEEEEDDTG